MTTVLNHLEPTSVFKYFEEICQIPRGSGNEKEISNYLVSVAKKFNLKVTQDEAFNVVIEKEGTKGYENAPTVILQGHMDMVCVKNNGVDHDFMKDPIQVQIKNDMVYANGTTLGADNGIAVAFCLAILASDDIDHPPLKVLVTTDEETGMSGAHALDPKHLEGKYLLNMDSEEEGYLLVSCAGGMTIKQTLPIVYENIKPSFKCYDLSFSGLKGGHSGMEINKGRANVNKLMGRFLDDLKLDYSLAYVQGGVKHNAIPSEGSMTICMNPTNVSILEEHIKVWEETFKNEFRVADPNLHISCTSSKNAVDKVFSEDTTKKLVDSLMLIPNGVQTMSMEIKDLVQSSINLAVVTTNEDTITFESSIRSSIKSLKYSVLHECQRIAKLLDCTLTCHAEYPEWTYDPDSELQKLFVKIYEDLFHKTPQIEAMHAGLECGLFKEKNKDLDMISFGPDMFDVHSPNEHLSISSTQRTWKYVLTVLKNIR